MKTNTKLTKLVNKKKNGFTLIEVIAVLVLLGILAAVAVPRYVDMSAAARDRAVDAGIAELNGRESLTWGNISISSAGYLDDATTFAAMDTELGNGYVVTGAAVGGATLSFQGGADVVLDRTASTVGSPGSWVRQ